MSVMQLSTDSSWTSRHFSDVPIGDVGRVLLIWIGSQNVVRRQRPPDPLQLELADWLDLHGVLDLRQHSWAD